MSFDLVVYADAHRYRTRNLHDGRRPLHPLRVPVRHRGRSNGYTSDEDRMDAIICCHGYVCDEGKGRIGWYAFSKNGYGINRWMPRLVAAGAVARQAGDREAAGDAPGASIDQILKVLRPYQRAKMLARQGALAPRSDATTSVGVSVPPRSRIDAKAGVAARRRRVPAPLSHRDVAVS